MARKNLQWKPTKPAAQIAVMHLQAAVSHLSVLRAVSRQKKLETFRRRIPIVMFGGKPEAVKIRHVPQNVGSPVSETRPTQSRRL